MVCHGLYPACDVGQITLQDLYLSIKLFTFCSPEKNTLFFFFFFPPEDIQACATDRWDLVWIWSLMPWIINFLLLSPEYLTKWVWSALGELQHKPCWALTSRTSEEGREICTLVHKDTIQLSPQKKEKYWKTSFHSRINKHCFSALILQKAMERCDSLLRRI